MMACETARGKFLLLKESSVDQLIFSKVLPEKMTFLVHAVWMDKNEAPILVHV